MSGSIGDFDDDSSLAFFGWIVSVGVCFVAESACAYRFFVYCVFVVCFGAAVAAMIAVLCFCYKFDEQIFAAVWIVRVCLFASAFCLFCAAVAWSMNGLDIFGHSHFFLCLCASSGHDDSFVLWFVYSDFAYRYVRVCAGCNRVPDGVSKSGNAEDNNPSDSVNSRGDSILSSRNNCR